MLVAASTELTRNISPGQRIALLAPSEFLVQRDARGRRQLEIDQVRLAGGLKSEPVKQLVLEPQPS